MRHPVAIVGAGQAGLACSHRLTQRGVPHVVLERGRVGEAWRSMRWDSFRLVTPNWMTRLPGKAYDGPEPDGFMARDDFVDWLEDYARSFEAPVRCGVDVAGVRADGDGFVLRTSAGELHCDNVVVATATYQQPRIPALAAGLPADVQQVHAGAYRNPGRIADGAVLVVGSGQSGCQIADELRRNGRRVYLSTGRAGRLLRRYRGRDAIAWQHDMGLLDRTPDMLDSPSLRFRGDPHLTGEGGGRTLNLHRFAQDGMVLLGRLASADGPTLRFDDDLAANLAFADDYEAEFCAKVDAFVAQRALDVPPADALNSDFGGARRAAPPPDVPSLDLGAAGIRTVVWATGFRYDFSWIDAPACLDEYGYPRQVRGVTDVPGLFFVGLNWLYKRKSGIIFGVGEDAEHLGDAIARRVGERAGRQAPWP
jgi:putative flavoprotein involved in K+ transport